MKTVADLKRAIKVGAKLASTHHLKFAGRNPATGETMYEDQYNGIREVSIVQATQWAMKTLKVSTGEYRDSWMPFPKRDEITFNADGSFTIRELNDRTNEWVNVITYQFMPETSSQVEFYGNNPKKKSQLDDEFDNVTCWNQ